MKKLSVKLPTFIALFLAVAVINIYVTDSYCSFTKETENHHSSLALTEQKKSHHSHDSEASEAHHHDVKKVREHHHEANPSKAEHHHNDEEATNHHEANHHNNDKDADEHHHKANQAKSSQHHHDVEEARAHCHKANQPECEHPSDGDNDDNCCKDNSSAFFSSLTNPLIHAVFIKAPINPLFFQENNFRLILTFDTFSSSPEYLLFRPPPNIPDIRIFIQSFII